MMTQQNDQIQETIESFGEIIKLNEMYYNCSKCSSPIEILSIDKKEFTIYFKCINNNRKFTIPIKEYTKKMKEFNNLDSNNDRCNNHNKTYECFCLDCNKHLCKECLISRDHISHNKYLMIEIQPNKNELKIIEDIIEYYENEIENLEKEKLIKTKELNNKLKKYKDKLKERKDLKIKEDEVNMKKEIQLRSDQLVIDIKKIRLKYENNVKMVINKFKNNLNKIKNRYKEKIDYYNIFYKKEIEILDNKYTEIIQKIGYNSKIENMSYLKRFSEIIYNTYNMYNNNYYNAININFILMNFLRILFIKLIIIFDSRKIFHLLLLFEKLKNY